MCAKPNGKSINLDYLRTISEGNEQFEQSMMKLYLKLTPKELDKMDKGLQSSDFDALHSSSHKLVSSVGMLGAECMKEKLLEVEILALTKSDFSRIGVLLQEIKNEHQKVCTELNNILAEAP